MTRTFIKILLLLLIIPENSDKYRSAIYLAYIDDKMEIWEKTLGIMDGIRDKSNEFLLELVNYQYGYIGYCLESGKKVEARKYLDLVQKNIEILENQNYRPGLIDSYKAAIYGFKISLNPISAPVNGPKSLECIKSALKLEPQNYFCNIQHGNIKNNMPSAFGGSKKEALDDYFKAWELMEKDSVLTDENWNYMNLLILIAETCTELKDYKSAMEVYKNILDLEPGFILVKNELYPKFLDKIRNRQ
jgi:tetratricopeptide (TPR) repeat protein